MQLTDLIAQQTAVGILRRAISSGRLAHAYLFQGPEGVGKRTAALLLAQALKCDRGGCGTCDICRKIERGAHPDVRVVGPAGGALAGASAELLEALGERANISIYEFKKDPDKPRSIPPPLVEDAYLHPYEGRWKIYIIDPADRMLPEAANTLLHLLEEPPEGVIIILVTSRPDALLPTVRSRCQKAPFTLAPDAAIKQALVDGPGLDDEQAVLLASLAEGRLGWALQTASRPEWLTTRALLLDWLGALPHGDARPALRCAAQLHALALQTMRGESEQAARSLPEGRLTENQMLRARLPMLFDIMACYYRDALLLAASGDHPRVVNLDRLDALRAEAARRTPQSLACALSALIEARDRLRRHANTDLTLDSLLLHLLQP